MCPPFGLALLPLSHDRVKFRWGVIFLHRFRGNALSEHLPVNENEIKVKKIIERALTDSTGVWFRVPIPLPRHLPRHQLRITS